MGGAQSASPLPQSPVSSSPSGFPLQSRSLRGGEEVHQELLLQGHYPHGAWESPVELHEDFEPPQEAPKKSCFNSRRGYMVVQRG